MWHSFHVRACVWVFVFTCVDRPKYTCTYYWAPKAGEQRSSDCTRLASRWPRVCVGVYVCVRHKYMCTYYRVPKAREQRSSDCTRLEAKPLAVRVRGCLFTVDRVFFACWKFSRISRFFEKSRKYPAAKNYWREKLSPRKRTKQGNFKKKSFKRVFSFFNVFVCV